MLGDHDRWAKSVSYGQSVRVPMPVAGPDVKVQTSSDALVAVHEFAATFLDYAGAKPQLIDQNEEAVCLGQPLDPTTAGRQTEEVSRVSPVWFEHMEVPH